MAAESVASTWTCPRIVQHQYLQIYQLSRVDLLNFYFQTAQNTLIELNKYKFSKRDV